MFVIKAEILQPFRLQRDLFLLSVAGKLYLRLLVQQKHALLALGCSSGVLKCGGTNSFPAR